VLRPILDHQSSTNAVLAHQVTRLAESDHVVAGQFAEMASRIGELTRRVQDLEREVAARPAPPDEWPGPSFPDAPQFCGQTGPAAETAGHHVLERLFLQTRLPAPPARVLTLSLDHATDLSQLGYQVVAADTTGVSAAPRLPFADGAFEVVVAMSGRGPGAGAGLWPGGPATRDEMLRVLVPGGRLIGSIRFDTPATAEVAERVAPFRVTHLSYSSWSGDDWVLHSDPTPESKVALWVAARP
jgi:hypothetical protein